MFRLWVNSCGFTGFACVYLPEHRAFTLDGEEEALAGSGLPGDTGPGWGLVQVGEHGLSSEQPLLESLDGGCGGNASGGHGDKGSMGVGKPPFLRTSPTACTAAGPGLAALAAAPSSSPGCAVALRPVPWSSPRSAFLLWVLLVAVRGGAVLLAVGGHPIPTPGGGEGELLLDRLRAEASGWLGSPPARSSYNPGVILEHDFLFLAYQWVLDLHLQV